MPHRTEGRHVPHPFVGMWHIFAMELWDASYFNMERQAFIEVRPDNLGSFQFGLVTGALDGSVEGKLPRQRYVFTWQGSDEMDPVSGSGSLKVEAADTIFGQFRIHQGDRPKFKARRGSPS
ncbi:MAG: hypothetical protein GEU90_16670 [Gemmatimonas sp.]|nr:hypothetical protein [Gemmatimonas sp.]